MAKTRATLSMRAYYSLLQLSRTPSSRLIRRFHSETPSIVTVTELANSSGSSVVRNFPFSVTPLEAPGEYNGIPYSEQLEAYKPGGYHPVMINDVLHDRYTIIAKTGYCRYFTVWLAKDSLTEELVTLKVGTAQPPVLSRECKILQALSRAAFSESQKVDAILGARDTVQQVLDEFEVEGPNGVHPCYSMPLVRGDLKKAIWDGGILPYRVSRVLAARLAVAVKVVHSQGLVHGDLSLENILVRAPPSVRKLTEAELREEYGDSKTVSVTRVDGRPLGRNVPAEVVIPLELTKYASEFDLADAKSVILGEFGEAFAPATEPRLEKEKYIPRAKKVPEAVFEPEKPLSYAADIWDLALAIFQIAGTGCLYFEMAPENEIVAEQIDLLGLDALPETWRQQWKRKSAMDGGPNDPMRFPPLAQRKALPPLEGAFASYVQDYRRKKEAASYDQNEFDALFKLIRGMLKFRPEERLTIDEVLESDWMVKWALPELQ